MTLVLELLSVTQSQEDYYIKFALNHLFIDHKINRDTTNTLFSGFRQYLLILNHIRLIYIMLLLIGYYLNVVGGRSWSESNGLPIAYIDPLQIDLDAAVLAGRNIVDYSVALPGILILLDLKVVGCGGNGIFLPNIPKGQCLIIAYIQTVDVGILH